MRPSKGIGACLRVTYIAEGKEKDGNPSLHYLTLLREGTRAHNLPEHWVRFLESIKHAE